MTQDKAQAAGAVSIDSPEFRNLVLEFGRALKLGQQTIGEHASLVDHIDAHAAQRYEAGFRKAQEDSGLLMANLKLRKEKQAAEASMARLVEALQGITALYDTDEGCRSTPEYIAARSALALLPAKAEDESLPELILRTGSILAAANEQSRLKLYRFDVLDQRGTVLAEGIGVHCHSMQEAEEKARKMLEGGESAIRFKSNAPCHPARKCAICSARPDLTGATAFANDGQEPDWKAHEAAECATTAPAMGEELPLQCQTETGLCGVGGYCKDCPYTAPSWDHEADHDNRTEFEAWMREECGADDDMLKRPHEGRYFWARTGDMWSAWERACMALRQPGDAQLIAEQNKLAKDRQEWALHQADIIRGLKARIVELEATPAAPVSQPAAQEVVAYLDLAKLRVGGMAYATAFRTGPKQVELFTAPAPLSAPAGSEQEKNAARYLELRNHHHMDDFGEGWLCLSFACGDKYPRMTEAERGAALDATVDAALAAKQEQSK